MVRKQISPSSTGMSLVEDNGNLNRLCGDNNNNENDSNVNLKKEDSSLIQEKYLRDATRYFRGLEKPLKYGPTAETLEDLIKGLHKIFESTYVNIEIVNHLLLSYKSNPKEWQKFAKWDRYRYTRNLVDAGNGKFNLMILCWGEGHASAIHDHSDSHCFMKMLQGELCETRYEMPPKEISNDENDQKRIAPDIGIPFTEDSVPECGELKKVSKHILELNKVCYINDNLGLHRVENLSHTDGAVSLHLYCPPFNECSIFQKNSAKRIKCSVTFWSKYGVRTDKVD